MAADSERESSPRRLPGDPDDDADAGGDGDDDVDGDDVDPDDDAGDPDGGDLVEIDLLCCFCRNADDGGNDDGYGNRDGD